MELNFSISELIHSDLAEKYNIKNIPDVESLDNLLNLIFYVLQPLREKLGKPIKVNSGYRCCELNKKVGGVNNSQHLRGQAADIIVKGMSIDDLIYSIRKSNIIYDQLIHEGSWVHISFSKGKNRLQYIEKKYAL